MSTCSVIMVSSRAGNMILAAVRGVLRQKNLAELILVDTGNPPHLLARLQQMTLSEPKLKIIPGAGNVVQAKALNLAAQRATGDFILFLGMDCLLAPEALVGLTRHASYNSSMTVTGGKILAPDGSAEPSFRRHSFSPQAAVTEIFHLHSDEKTSAESSEMQPVEILSGMMLCIRREDFFTLGGLDETVGNAWDYDLCRRVRRANGKMLFMPDVTATHMQQSRGKANFPAQQWALVQGHMRYFRKHFSDDSVPGFLSLLYLMLLWRCLFRIITHRMRRLVSPARLMSHTVAAKRLMILASGLTELPQKKDWYGKTVLVTGATSQTGLCVIKHLISEGAAVLAISRGNPIPYAHEHLRWIQGDLTDANLDLQGYLVDAVVHCAPLWTLPLSLEKLADAEVKRIIAFGSTSIFGKAHSSNAFEKDFVRKLGWAEEEIAKKCERYSIQWTILRPTLTYGVGLDLGITSIAKCIDRHGLFFVYPPASGRRQPVHADDLAKAVVLAMHQEKTHGKSYNISGGEVLTFYQMLERLFEVCKKKPRIIGTTFLPFMMTLAGLIMRRRHLNGEIAHRMNDDLIFFHDDAKKDFGFSARAFLSGGLKDIEGF